MLSNRKKNDLLSAIFLISYFLLTLFIFRKFLFVDGLFGLQDDWAFPPLPAQYSALVDGNKYSWITAYSGSLEFRSMANYLTIAMAVLNRVFNFGGEFYSKGLFIFFISLAGVSFYVFSKKSLGFSRPAAYLGGLIYMLSPLVFNSVISGYIILVISYAFLPLFFLVYRQIILNNKFDLRKIFLAGLLLRIVFSQDFFILLSAVVISSYFLFETIVYFRKIKDWLLAVLQTGIIFLITLLLSAPFFLVLLTNRGQVSSFAGGQIVSWNTFVAPILLKAFSLDGAGYRYFLNAITKGLMPWWFSINFFLAVVALCALLIVRKTRMVIYFSFLVLGSIFIFKGVNQPFGQANMFIINKFPSIMVLIRNVQYITALTSFGYGALFGYSLDKVFFNHKKNREYSVVAFTIFFVLLVINAFPYFSGDFGGQAQLYKLDKSYNLLDGELRSDNRDYRVYWLPPLQPLTYKNSQFAGQDPMVWGSAKPFVGNGAPMPILRTMAYNFYTGENLNFQNMLAFMGIGKIIYRSDFFSRLPDYMGPDFEPYRKYWTNQNLKHTLESTNGINLERKVGDAIEVYENKFFLPHFYIPQKQLYLRSGVEGLMDIGSLGGYQLRSAIYLDEGKDREDDFRLADYFDETIIKALRIDDSDNKQLNYEIDIPKEDNYQLCIGGFNQLLPENMQVVLGEKIAYSGKIVIDEKGWFCLLKKHLEKKTYKLSISFKNWFKPPTVLARAIRDTPSLKNTPKITFIRINQTKYRVKVEGAKEPYLLVFSEAFHRGWKAYINKDQRSKIKDPSSAKASFFVKTSEDKSADKQNQYGKIIASYFDGEIKEGTHKNVFLNSDTFETWGATPIAEDRHLLINSYANAWYLTPKDADEMENYELIIDFHPQRYFYIGIGLTVVVLFITSGYLLFPCLFKNRMKAK